MRIVEVDAEAHEATFAIRMRRLGPVVVLAGANGAGKTRILRRLEHLADSRCSKADLDTNLSLLKSWRTMVAREKDPGLVASLSNQIAGAEQVVREHERLRIEPIDERTKIVWFVPELRDMFSYRQVSIADIQTLATLASEPGSRHLERAALPYIRQLQQAYVHARAMGVEDRSAVDAYEALRTLVRQLIGSDLGIDPDEPTLFGVPIYRGVLSRGQLTLLQLAVALHAQQKRLGELIIALDEPELHLHPKALLEVLDRIKQANGGGQLWIATHSISVLSWAGHKAVWYVADEKVSWAGRGPSEVLASLLGDEARRLQLQALLTLPRELACVEFAAECLVAPRAVTTGPGDSQLTQIRAALEALRLQRQGRIRVLDYGAGTGRLAAALADVREKVEYVAYEPFSEDPAGLVAAALEVDGRVILDRPSMEGLDDASVDVVVLCNALHELRAAAWIRELGAGSIIQRKLAPDGYLLVVEDEFLRTGGERAHEHGFLLLGHQELRRLFAVAESDSEPLGRSEPAPGLGCTLVPAKYLVRLTPHTRVDALGALSRRAKDEIRRIRESNSPDYKTGEKLALYSQLFANSALALEEYADP